MSTILKIIENNELSNIEKAAMIEKEGDRMTNEKSRKMEKITIKRGISEKYGSSTSNKIPVEVSIGGRPQPQLKEEIAIRKIAHRVESMAIKDRVDFTWKEGNDAATFERAWLIMALDIVFEELSDGIIR